MFRFTYTTKNLTFRDKKTVGKCPYAVGKWPKYLHLRPFFCGRYWGYTTE